MNPRSIFSFTPKRFFAFLTLLYVSFIIVSSAIIYFVSIEIHSREVNQIANRMKENITFSKGKWDLSYLNSDPELPGTNSHYILATDGYVIERWRPISGFLNTSDMQYLLQFTSPQTVIAPTNEQWRMLSTPIKDGNNIIGVFTASRHISEEDDISIIDEKLKKEQSFVLARVKVVDGKMDISKLDIRQTQFDISFKLVDRYNAIIVKTNNSNSIERTPNYIDRSYVAEELQAKRFRIIRDTQNDIPYFVTNTPVVDENGQTVGVVVIAKSLDELQNLMVIYIIGQAVLLISLSPLLWLLYKRLTHRPSVKHLHFDQENGIIEINNDTIEIPLETNQYELVSLIFKEPRKGWSVSEIADHFDDQSGNVWRKVYDSMLLVNKRVEPHLHDKLIIVADKRFCMSPKLAGHIK